MPRITSLTRMTCGREPVGSRGRVSLKIHIKNAINQFTKMKKPLIFVQDIDPYKHQMLVCVGATHAQTLQWLKKNKFTKESQEFFKTCGDIFDRVMSGRKAGMVKYGKKKGREYLIMVLPHFKGVLGTWDYWDTLLHETHHIVDWIADYAMLDGEMEAKAYLHEHLFRSIRRRIYNLHK